MPQATDLVIDNGAAVAKTFTNLAPASGWGGVAEWALKEGTVSSVFPRITLSAKRVQQNGGGNSAVLKLAVPASYTDTVTGLTKVSKVAEAFVTVKVPDDFPEALKADFQAFLVNGVANAMVKACLKDGLPAT